MWRIADLVPFVTSLTASNLGCSGGAPTLGPLPPLDPLRILTPKVLSYISVRVPLRLQGSLRDRKGVLTVFENLLGVCHQSRTAGSSFFFYFHSLLLSRFLLFPLF